MNGVTVARSGQIENFIPPEGVPITFVLASRGARLGAQILDIIITFGGTLAFILLLAWSGVLGLAPLMALYLLLTFFIRIPYYIFAELVWNGRTSESGSSGSASSAPTDAGSRRIRSLHAT